MRSGVSMEEEKKPEEVKDLPKPLKEKKVKEIIEVEV